jgi:hypothetical protein
MPSNACILCATLNNARATECSNCGLAFLPTSRNSQPAAEAVVRSAAPRRRRWLPVAWAGVFCLIGIGLTIVSGRAALSSVQRDVQSPPAVSHSDPAQAADWREGEAALRQVLGKPSYDSFGGSFISVSFGQVTSICGATDAKFDPDGTERYVVVINSPSTISLEFQDPTFSTLWERTCKDGTA